MSLASTTSPFCFTDDKPWVIWQQKVSVGGLENNTTQPGFEDHLAESIPSLPYVRDNSIQVTNQIRRTQYNAVLSRLNLASKKTGSFASWNS